MGALCGDVGNVFVNTYTTEQVYAIDGLEFGEKLRDEIIVIRKALYGLATSCAIFHYHLSDTLQSIDFLPTRFDRDVLIRFNKETKTYEHLCNHVNDFCIFSKQVQKIVEQNQAVYTVKSIGPPDCYLDNNFKRDSKGRWNMGCNKYMKKAVTHVERMFGQLTKHDTPMVAEDHPEMDDSVVLGDEDHQNYQMLI
eukprot:12837078-Ditylum_brightwellii.AAC.1